MANGSFRSAQAMAMVSSAKGVIDGGLLMGWVWYLERQSRIRFARPARHRKSMSYSCRLRAHPCSFGSTLRLRISHLSVEQFVTKAKRQPARHCLKCLMAHKTAIHSRSVGPRRQSVFEKWWLAKARTRSSCPNGCRSTAPTPTELVYICTDKARIRPFLAN